MQWHAAIDAFGVQVLYFIAPLKIYTSDGQNASKSTGQYPYYQPILMQHKLKSLWSGSTRKRQLYLSSFFAVENIEPELV